jgi:hypothetical protein
MRMDERIAQCGRGIMKLDTISKGSERDTIASAVNESRAIYDDLLDQQEVEFSAPLQETLDRLRARLRFFGEKV